MAMGAIQKNILETHISIMAQEQIQLEFVEEMTRITNDSTTITTNGMHRIQKWQQQMMQNPQMQCRCNNNEFNKLLHMVLNQEKRKLIAEMHDGLC